jgi:hypothetical protein
MPQPRVEQCRTHASNLKSAFLASTGTFLLDITCPIKALFIRFNSAFAGCDLGVVRTCRSKPFSFVATLAPLNIRK